MNFNGFVIIPILFRYYIPRMNYKDGTLVSFVISRDIHKFEKKHFEQNLWRDLEFVFYFNIQ